MVAQQVDPGCRARTRWRGRPQQLLAQLLLLLAAHLSIQQSFAYAREAPQQRRQLLQDEVVRKLTGGYLSNEDLASYLEDFTKRCSGIAKLSTFGSSVGGFPLLALELSTKPGMDEPKPQVKYVGNIHGDEPSGRQLLLLLAETLCAEYKQPGTAAHTLLSSFKLVLVPSMNPDGFSAHRRENKNGVDLNRNFPDPIKNPGVDLRQPLGREQQETLMMMNFTLTHRFVASLVVHEGALVANYPFDGYADGSMQVTGKRNPSPDDSAFMHLATTYANLHTTMHKSLEFKQGITNGAQWYPVYGGMQDWNYLAANCMEVTLELNQDKWPTPERLGAMWVENKAALLQWPLKTVWAGLRGVVKGNRAGEKGLFPLKATVSVVGIDHNVTSSAQFGDYYRVLAPGTEHTVIVSAPGYAPASAKVTIPADGSGLVKDWTLALEGTTLPAASGGGSEAPAGASPDPSTSGKPGGGKEAEAPLPTHEEGGWVVLGDSGRRSGGGWSSPYVLVPLLGAVAVLGAALFVWRRRVWAVLTGAAGGAGYAQLLPMQQFPRPPGSGGGGRGS